jgi:putative ABC transport system ATP-binding protein
MITLTNLTKIYEEGNKNHKVLCDLNYKFESSEISIMYGRSGSGKSTLLNLISGIDKPTSGNIFIDNRDITTMNEKERTIFRRVHIGFIFQFFNLIPTLNVFENLLLPLELVGKIGKNEKQKAEDLLNDVGLIDKKNSYPDRLSGGEQQRVAIARALIHDPAIILADEPTGNLDYETGLQIIELLDRLVKSEKKLMIMATHSKDVIGLADKILMVKDGKLSVANNERL